MTGLVPKPKCTIYTNLACDGNMMTFPYLKQKYQIPGFYIDVPYEKIRIPSAMLQISSVS